MKIWKDNLRFFPKMKDIGIFTSQCLKEIKNIIKPGITTADIEDYVKEYQQKYNLQNSQLGFQGFPSYVCVGKNDLICHGIPSKNVILNEGDIIKVDVTFNKDGFHGDAAMTFPVGKIDEDTTRLISIAYEAMNIGINNAFPGKKISDIGAAIESYVVGQKMSVVKDFTGHGIFHEMHEPPVIRHFWDPNAKDIEIVPGMCFTIEPIICAGKPNGRVLKDKWSIVTIDGSWSAQFEKTIGITETGQEIFTPDD